MTRDTRPHEGTWKWKEWYYWLCQCGGLHSSKKPIIYPCFACKKSVPDDAEYPEMAPDDPMRPQKLSTFDSYSWKAHEQGYTSPLDKMWETEVGEMTDDEKQDWGIPT